MKILIKTTIIILIFFQIENLFSQDIDEFKIIKCQFQLYIDKTLDEYIKLEIKRYGNSYDEIVNSLGYKNYKQNLETAIKNMNSAFNFANIVPLKHHLYIDCSQSILTSTPIYLDYYIDKNDNLVAFYSTDDTLEENLDTNTFTTLQRHALRGKSNVIINDSIFYMRSSWAGNYSYTSFIICKDASDNMHWISDYIFPSTHTWETDNLINNIYVDPKNEYIYTMTTCAKNKMYISKYNFNSIKENNPKMQTIPYNYAFSKKFLGNDKRLVWLYGDAICKPYAHYNGIGWLYDVTGWENDIECSIHNNIYGISYINLTDSFIGYNIKKSTGLLNIKSDLDNYYASYPKTDSMVSRYINMLGFKDNNLLVMLRDKWVDTLAEKKERNDSVDYNFAWYESTIYTFDFNPMGRWDTLNLHEAFSMLQVPEKWVVENREVGKPNLYANVPIDYFGIYKWSDNELAVALQPKDVLLIHPDLENANRILLIYNFDTKKWSKFTFPNTFPFYSNKTVTDWNGSKYFHITSSNASDTTYRNALVKWTLNTGITAETELSTLKVYPNPTLNYLDVKLDNAYAVITAEIVDLDGKLLFKMDFENKKDFYINFPFSLSDGTYLLLLTADGKQTTTSFVIIK